jgi:ferrochelatase
MKLAVVLSNLGGPDGPDAVRPFLYNLFSDPAIIGAPAFVRKPLAAFIAKSREKSAIANYAIMGGGSPIVPETAAQVEALKRSLRTRRPVDEIEVFMAMRYWKPRAAEVAQAVRDFAPDEVVLAPLYPQYSTTTTASSHAEWREHYKGPCREICCWYMNPGLIEAHALRIEQTWIDAGRPKVRLLFSAHGLPEKISNSGDPYRWQIEQTCAAIAKRLGAAWDWTLCFQSRVGPMKWIGPTTPEAIADAARDGVGVLIDPVAFVSEHVETLVELDHDYEKLARGLGVEIYLRAPAVGASPVFIEGLADAVERALSRPGVAPDGPACPMAASRCGLRVLT